jgi:hypothetical protein
LDAQTRALLGYASKLTETPSLVNKDDIEPLRNVGWNERAIWEITALISFFNFSGRLEAASGLPPDQIPEGASSPRRAIAESRITYICPLKSRQRRIFDKRK